MKIAALTAALLGTFAFAVPKESERVAFSERFPGCDVRLWNAMDVAGGRCRFLDEVMVGIRTIDPLIIRCARLDVRCNRAATEKRD
jgi:hypothetical protein